MHTQNYKTTCFFKYFAPYVILMDDQRTFMRSVLQNKTVENVKLPYSTTHCHDQKAWSQFRRKSAGRRGRMNLVR